MFCLAPSRQCEKFFVVRLAKRLGRAYTYPRSPTSTTVHEETTPAMLSLPSATRFAVPQETVDLVREVVQDKILRAEMFSSVTVTNEVKRRALTRQAPAGQGRHSEMAEVIRAMFPTDMIGYQRVTVTLVNPKTGEDLSTELYAPDHSDPSDYARFEQTGWEDTLRPLLPGAATQPVLPAAPPAVTVTAKVAAPAQKAIPGPGKTGGPVLGAHILGDV
jgi:hypothetical protein